MRFHFHKWFKAGLGVLDGKPVTAWLCDRCLKVKWTFDKE